MLETLPLSRGLLTALLAQRSHPALCSGGNHAALGTELRTPTCKEHTQPMKAFSLFPTDLKLGLANYCLLKC